MIFVPYPDEVEQINVIHKVRNDDYVLLRLTPTMIEKNNLDANEFFRDLLLRMDLVNYDELEHGSSNGIVHNALLISDKHVSNVNLKFYKVAGTRGDRRFSIETIKKKMRENVLNEGDLLYFSTFENGFGENQIFFINLSQNTPSEQQLIAAIGRDEINEKLKEIMPLLRVIMNGGYYDNSKGTGKKAAKDIGDTFESLLNVETNNRKDADIGGLIEIKTKGESSTLDTLFTLRPNFEGTKVEQYEPNDRQRVSAFARMYGYDSDKHPGYSSLYITIGAKNAPQNTKGFYLEVDESNNVVNLMKAEEGQKAEITGYWRFQDLKKQLEDKHPATLWVSAEERVEDDLYQFKYTDIEFSRRPQFMTFLSLIKAGIITYDWRGYTTKEGKYSGKNHGNAWRIKPQYKKHLFGELEKLEI